MVSPRNFPLIPIKAIGCLVRAVSGDNYIGLLIGQGISQMTYVIFSTVAGRLAVALVPQNKISMATGLCGAGIRWGGAFGLIVPPLIFKGLSVTSDLDEIGNRLKFYNWALFITTLVCLLLFYFLYRSDNEHGSAAQRKSFVELIFIVFKLAKLLKSSYEYGS